MGRRKKDDAHAMDLDYDSDLILSDDGGVDDPEDCQDEFTSSFDAAVSTDDKDGLHRLMETSDESFFVDKNGYLKLLYLLSICAHGAFRCAKWLLEDNIQYVNVDVNTLKLRTGTYPIHEATASFNCDLVELLLRHGARVDVLTNQGRGSCSVQPGLLPLNVAVEGTSVHKYLKSWNKTKKKSDAIFKLIIFLCLPEMKRFLAVVRLLAERSAETVNEILNYLDHGKLVQLAILMMAARKKIDKCTLNLIQSRIDEAIGAVLPTYLDSSKVVLPDNVKRHINEKKEAMVSARILLQVFEKAGDAIDDYLQSDHHVESHKEIIEHVASLLSCKGFVVDKNLVDVNKLECYHYHGDDDRFREIMPTEPLSIQEMTQPWRALDISMKLSNMINGSGTQDISTHKSLLDWHRRRFLPPWKGALSDPNWEEEPFYMPMDQQIILSVCGKLKRATRQHAPLPSYQSRMHYATAASTMMRVLRRI